MFTFVITFFNVIKPDIGILKAGYRRPDAMPKRPTTAMLVSLFPQRPTTVDAVCGGTLVSVSPTTVDAVCGGTRSLACGCGCEPVLLSCFLFPSNFVFHLFVDKPTAIVVDCLRQRETNNVSLFVGLGWGVSHHPLVPCRRPPARQPRLLLLLLLPLRLMLEPTPHLSRQLATRMDTTSTATTTTTTTTTLNTTSRTANPVATIEARPCWTRCCHYYRCAPRAWIPRRWWRTCLKLRRRR